jgi:cytochrome c oxidase subunit II
MIRTHNKSAVVSITLAFTILAGSACDRQDNARAPKEVGLVSSTQLSANPKDADDPKDVEKGAAPGDAIEIQVVASQWLWRFQHADGIREVGELHVPVGKPFKLSITSEDVVHSLCIRDWKIGLDAIPGKTMTDWTTATKSGRYSFHCGETCGAGHAKHIGTLVVMEQADFEKWQSGLSDQPLAKGSLASRGRQLFLKHQCVRCHSGEDKAKGPILEGLWGKNVPLRGGTIQVADDHYIRESIRRPLSKIVEGWGPSMPEYDERRISEEELLALIAYIRSLKPGDTPKRIANGSAPIGSPKK